MGYGRYMRTLLRPLGVYRLTEGNLNYSETEACGEALDGVASALEETEREGLLTTAGEASLQKWAALFAHPPAAPTEALLRAAVGALLRIGGSSFTPAAINETISGCGVSCAVEELETPGTVRVSFPGTAGVPADFFRMAVIIESILPCHLGIEWFFRFMTWRICADKGYTWARAEAEGHSWGTFYLAVN